jgi:hypothetical protein
MLRPVAIKAVAIQEGRLMGRGGVERWELASQGGTSEEPICYEFRLVRAARET